MFYKCSYVRGNILSILEIKVQKLVYRNVNWSLFVKLKAIEFALNELRCLRHAIVSLYFYFASSSATLIPYNLDKLVSTSFIYQFLYLFISKIDSSKIFHEYINTSYILSDIYCLSFFLLINILKEMQWI